MKLSVIICSHNPRESYLARCLDALKVQSLGKEHWELLLVDNASDSPIQERHDISWHPNAKIVHEGELGLTYARLRGIAESKGAIIVFVDDDNLLRGDYLETALIIGENHPNLGAWGGSSIAEYEEDPPSWFKPYEGSIAVRKVPEVRWSNRYFDYESTPVGAGMCLRDDVAKRYLERLQNDDRAINLGRKGSVLMSCEDHDLAWTSMQLGLGMGVFPELELIHIIPAERIRAGYLFKLLEGGACSTAILRHNINGSVEWPNAPKSFPKLRSVVASIANLFVNNRRDIHFQANQARVRGMLIAKEMLENDTK